MTPLYWVFFPLAGMAFVVSTVTATVTFVRPSLTVWKRHFSDACLHGAHQHCIGACAFCGVRCWCKCHRQQPEAAA